MTEKHKKILYLLSIAIFMLFCVLAGWYVGLPMVRFAENPEQFRSWVDASGLWSRVIFIGMVILQVMVAFIPGEAIELAAGYAFGGVEGTVLSMVGIAIGSCIIYLAVRRFGVKMVEVFFSQERISEVSFLKNPRKAKVLAFLLMLIPGTPKDFLSYFAGLTSLTLRQWLQIVVIARLPSVLTSTLTGAAAGEKQYKLAIGMLVITTLISAAGILYYRKICKEENEAIKPDDLAA